MNIQKIPADRLNPAAYNPRKDLQPNDAEYKKLKRSLTEFGIVEPIVWNERTGNIVGGHQRFKVLRDLGVTEVDCVVVDLDENREKALNIALNKIQGEWDEGKLAELFAGFDLADFDTTLTGFDTDEIETLLDGFYNKECIEDDFDEEAAKQAVADKGGAETKPGDLWLLGEHRLLCGDSTNPADFAKLMGAAEGGKAALCVTSPPYGVGKEYESKGLEPWFETMRPAIKNICKHAAVVCYNIGDLFSTGSQFIEPTFAYSVQMFADNGFRPIWVRIWDKKRQALSNNAPYHLATNKPIGDAEWLGAFASEGENQTDIPVVLDDHGYIVAAAGHNYRFVKRLSRAERKEWGYSSMWRFASVQGAAKTKDRLDERNHKARFPITLPWRCIKMHSDKGDIILEPFSGTFSTGMACQQLGRRCFAMELSPEYCDIAVERFRKEYPDLPIERVVSDSC
jgi:DNA modification methylase